MTLSRRDLSKLALGGAIAAQAAPASAFFHARLRLRDLPKRLAQALNADLHPDCVGKFTVFDNGSVDVPFWVADVVIHLEWPPGERQRPFLSTGNDGEEAFDKVFAQARAYFGDVWKRPDGSSCFV